MDLAALFDSVRTFAASLAPGDALRSIVFLLESGQEIRLPVPPLEQEFRTLADNYSSVCFRGETYTFGGKQATIVRRLHEASLDGVADVSQAALLEAAESDGKSLRDLFRNGDHVHPAWGTLIVGGASRGVFRLNLRGKAG